MRACSLLSMVNGEVSIAIEYAEKVLRRWGGPMATKGQSVIIQLVSGAPYYDPALNIF